MPAAQGNRRELRTEAAATLGTPDIQLAAVIELPAYDLTSCNFSPDGRTLVSAGHQTGLNFWDVSGRRHLSARDGLIASKTRFDTVLYFPDGKGLAIATANDGIVCADETGLRTARAPITRGKSQPTKLALSRDGHRLAAAWTDGAGITVHDSDSGTLLQEFKDSRFALSPDGRWIAAQESGDIVLLPVASGEPRITLGRRSEAHAFAFNPDGRCSPQDYLITPRSSGIWQSVNNSVLFEATANES
jgi:WD40 repeat protein